MIWRLMKTAIFTLLAPGTVALYLPGMLRERSAGPAIHSFYLYPWLALFLCGAAIYLWCAWDFAVRGWEPRRQSMRRAFWSFGGYIDSRAIRCTSA